jgi:hypothetical protein
MLSLRAAAEMAGTSKSSIFRAIRSGRLSAARGDDGSFQIEPSELVRAFPPQVSRPDIPRPASSGQTDRHAGTPDMAIRNAQLEGEVKALGAEVRLLREAVDRLERDRDRWHDQAQRLALAPPQRRAWWPWRRAG